MKKISVYDVLTQLSLNEILVALTEEARIVDAGTMADDTTVFTLSTGVEVMLSPDPDHEEVYVREQAGTKVHVVDAFTLNSLSDPVLNLMFLVWNNRSDAPAREVLVRHGGDWSLSGEVLTEAMASQTKEQTDAKLVID